MTVSLKRKTKETEVDVRLALEPGRIDIDTEYGFLDHMLEALASYAGWSLHVRARGDLFHHLIEDVAITLGKVFERSVPQACSRFAEQSIVMDDAWVQVALDIGGRFYFEGPLPHGLYEHFLRSFAENASMTLHLRVLRGRDDHHIIEAGFKALGLALRQAASSRDAVFSTKGKVKLEWGGETC